MQKILSIIMSGLTLVAFTAAAYAGPTDTPGVDKRQTNQEKRIQQGAKSGQLTPEEAAKLEKQQGRIQKAEDTAKADGKVTAKERKKLHKMQNNASENIYRKKHNRQTAQ